MMIANFERCKQILWHIQNGAEAPYNPAFANAFAKLKDWYSKLDHNTKETLWEDEDYFMEVLRKDNFYQKVFENN